MDAFEDRIARLGDLTDDEIASLEQELVAAFDSADGEGDVDTMSSLADSLDTVRAERQRRASTPAATAPAAAPEAPVAAEPVAASGTELLDPPETADAASESDTTLADELEAPAADTEADEPADITPADEADTEVPVAEADATDDEGQPSQEEEQPTMADEIDLTANDTPAEAQPDEATFTPPTVIRAGGDIPGRATGEELTSLDDVAEAMTSRINSFARLTGGDGEQVVVASLSVEPTDDNYVLHRGDVAGNSTKIRKALDPEVITAAGNGWCAPRSPIYTIFGLGETGRPVRDSLPSFTADRGGIVWTTPPKLSDAGFGAGLWAFVSGEPGEWQAAGSPASATPTADTKVLYDATCPAELTADLEAITSQLRFSNMMARAYPELVRRNMELALIAHDRFAESRLLYHMWALADTAVTANPSIVLGAARDVLFTFRNLGASYRNRHRMAPNASLEAWAPGWMRDVIAADLTAQMPGDDTISTGYGEIDAYLAAINVSVTWYWDDVPGNGTSQYFAAADSAFPANAAVIMASPGTYLHLDGGTLDLGVVRDSTLVGTNQYVEFSESFENVAKVGVEALKVTVPMFVVGGSAGGVTTTAGITLS